MGYCGYGKLLKISAFAVARVSVVTGPSYSEHVPRERLAFLGWQSNMEGGNDKYIYQAQN